jgi:hypothetical protein
MISFLFGKEKATLDSGTNAHIVRQTDNHGPAFPCHARGSVPRAIIYHQDIRVNSVLADIFDHSPNGALFIVCRYDDECLLGQDCSSSRIIPILLNGFNLLAA